jgi:hypothetical protein
MLHKILTGSRGGTEKVICNPALSLNRRLPGINSQCESLPSFRIKYVLALVLSLARIQWVDNIDAACKSASNAPAEC